jgi:hypothetical protein
VHTELAKLDPRARGTARGAREALSGTARGRYLLDRLDGVTFVADGPALTVDGRTLTVAVADRSDIEVASVVAHGVGHLLGRMRPSVPGITRYITGQGAPWTGPDATLAFIARQPELAGGALDPYSGPFGWPTFVHRQEQGQRWNDELVATVTELWWRDPDQLSAVNERLADWLTFEGPWLDASPEERLLVDEAPGFDVLDLLVRYLLDTDRYVASDWAEPTVVGLPVNPAVWSDGMGLSEAQRRSRDRIAKHYGPGPHPSGSPQTEHGRRGERHWSTEPEGGFWDVFGNAEDLTREEAELYEVGGRSGGAVLERSAYGSPLKVGEFPPDWLTDELNAVRPHYYRAAGYPTIHIIDDRSGGEYHYHYKRIDLGILSIFRGAGVMLDRDEFRATLHHELAHGIEQKLYDYQAGSFPDKNPLSGGGAFDAVRGLRRYFERFRELWDAKLEAEGKRADAFGRDWVAYHEAGDPWAYPAYGSRSPRELLAEALAYIETGHADLVEALDAEVGPVEGLPGGGLMGLWRPLTGLSVPKPAVAKHAGHLHGMPVPCYTTDPVAKHYGPGDHPGTGTPQTEHGRRDGARSFSRNPGRLAAAVDRLVAEGLMPDYRRDESTGSIMAAYSNVEDTTPEQFDHVMEVLGEPTADEVAAWWRQASELDDPVAYWREAMAESREENYGPAATARGEADEALRSLHRWRPTAVGSVGDLQWWDWDHDPELVGRPPKELPTVTPGRWLGKVGRPNVSEEKLAALLWQAQVNWKKNPGHLEPSMSALAEGRTPTGKAKALEAALLLDAMEQGAVAGSHRGKYLYRGGGERTLMSFGASDFDDLGRPELEVGATFDMYPQEFSEDRGVADRWKVPDFPVIVRLLKTPGLRVASLRAAEEWMLDNMGADAVYAGAAESGYLAKGRFRVVATARMGDGVMVTIEQVDPKPGTDRGVAKHYGPGDHPGTGTPQAVHNPHTHEAAEAGERHWTRNPTVAEAHRQATEQLNAYLHPWIESSTIGFGVFDFLHHSVTNWFMEHDIGDVLAPPGDRDKWDGPAMEAYTAAYQTLGSPNHTDRPVWTRDGQMVVHPWSRNGRGQWRRQDAFGPGPNQVRGSTAEADRGPWQVHDQHPDDWVEATGLAWDARTGLPLERINDPGKYMPADEVLVAADGTLWRINPQQYSGDADTMRDITGSMLGDLWAGNKRPRGELFRPDRHTTVTVEPVGPSEDQRLVWAYQEASIQVQLDMYGEVQATEKQREDDAVARVDAVIERGYEVMKQLQRTRDAVMEERGVTNAIFNQAALPEWLKHRWSAELTVEEIPDAERFDPLRRAVRLRDKARAEHKARSDQLWTVNTMLTRRAAHVAEADDPETTPSYQAKVPWVVVPRNLTDPLIVVAPPLEDSPATLPELERLHAETFTPEERSLVAIQEAVDSTGRGPGNYGVDPVLAELAGDSDKLEAALREAEVLTATHQGSMPGLSRAAATAAAIAASAGGRAYPLYEIRGVDPKGAPPRRYGSGGSAPARFGDPNIELWERLDQDMQNSTKRQHQYADEAGGLYELHKVRESSSTEALLRVLAGIRPMGGTIDYETTTPLLTGQGDLLGEFFPTAWVEASNVERMRFIPATRKERGRTLDRGYYDGLRAVPVIATDGAKTTLHELGHRMEHRVPGLHDVVRAFYERRTRGETAQKLTDLRPNSAYEDHETTKPDAFGDPYMGKLYSGQRNSEIVSMAIPALFGAADRYALDPEMKAFVLGLLAGEGETDG